MKKRGVLSLWKVILLVITGLVGIAGVTILGLYLTGSFNEKENDPQDMAFSQVLDEGLGNFNSTLQQYEIASDFKITIVSTTENVTNNKVTLSLRGGQAKNGFVSDGVIKVPQVVTLNKSFNVTLEPEYNADIFEDWVVGGTSLLTAKSENVLLPSKTIKIVVDVPVYDINLQVSGSNQTGNVQEVVVGSTFKLETSFIPNDSKYLFSDQTRTKEIFYSSTSRYIDFDWESSSFVATQRSGNNVDTITAYTFANSYYQKQILELYSSITDKEALTSSVLRYFEQKPQTCISKEINIKVLDVDVDFVEMTSENKSFKTYLDKYFTLTTASSNGDANLGLSIKDSTGANLNPLFGNVGIKMPKGETGLKILGGKVMKVTTTNGVTTISQETFDSTIDYFNAPAGTEYYLLPNTSPKNFGDYYWKIAASTAESFNLKFNFFYEDEEGIWQNFFSFEPSLTSGEKQIILVAEEHDYEEDPAWTNNDSITLTINYDENGVAVAGNKTLSDELNPINTDNIYQTVKYFLFVDSNDNESAQNLDLTTAFNCKQAVNYRVNYKNQTLSIPGTSTPTNGYNLYEIDNPRSVLTAVKSFAGKVKVVAMTIKTDADSKPYTEDGKYLIVKSSRSKDVMVESTLAIANIVPTFNFAAGIVANPEYNNEYYIPAINKNESSETKTMLTFQMTLKNCEDPENDSNKVISAFNSGNLKVVCLDLNGRETNNYVTLQGLVEKEVGQNEITFEGNFAIEEGFFSAGRNALDMGTYIRLQLQYNDGKEIFKKDILQQDSLTANNHFYIYYQQPVAFEGEFKKQTDLDADGDNVEDNIQVSITASNGIRITWGNKVIAGSSTEEILNNLNDLLTFKMYDQFGKEIESSTGIYKYRFVETPETGSSNILAFDNTVSKISNFVSTQGEKKTTTLTAHVLDKDNNVVRVFDEQGNVTSNTLKSQNIIFDVVSEGISKVQYDNTKTMEETPNYVDSANKGSVKVEKFVTSGDVVDLNSLVKIFIAGLDGEEETNNVVFKLDNDYLSGLSSKNKLDIMKMVQFNVSETDIGENTGDSNNIEYYRNHALSKMTIINPFKEDTEMVFRLRDENETLFDVTLTFVCKSDVTVSSSFNTYYEDYSDYLVQDGNAVSVFAGNSYDLDEFINLSSATGKKYSWVNALGNLGSLESSNTGVFYENQDICSLSKVTENGSVTKILLNIGEVYQFKTVSFTLYYGINSFYACSITITLYVNPNLVIREQLNTNQETPFINLGNVSEARLSTSYKLYKMTDYLENGNSFESCTEIVSNKTQGNLVFTYENVSVQKYINLLQSGNDFEFKFVNEQTLELSLGENKLQEFNIYAQREGVDAQPAKIDAVKIVEGEEENKIILCDKNNSAKIDFNVGYGSDKVEEMASSVLKKQTPSDTQEDVSVVNYGGKTYLLLTSSTDYQPQNDFNIDGNPTGYLTKSGNKLHTYELTNEFVSETGNSFNVAKNISDSTGNNLTVVISMDAIVSKVGEQFVYYANSPVGTIEELKFNSFGDVDFKTLISSDYQQLEQAKVAQILTAGKEYTIVHNSEDIKSLTNDLFSDFISDAYGLYFNATTANVVGQNADAGYKVSIVEEAEGYLPGLATLTNAEGQGETKLIINDLESSQTEAYIVLKFELKKHQGNTNYTWFYRIKVTSSFTVGKVTYPYAETGEYLDVYSNYYNQETSTYSIDLEEQFNSSNSKFDGGKRFADINWTSTSPENVTWSYSVKSAVVGGVEIEKTDYSSYFTYNFDEDNFSVTLVDQTTKLILVIEKSFAVEGITIIGSEMEYTFYFNQGQNYIHSLKQDEEVLTAKNNIYETSISAGSEEAVFDADIRILSNNTESKVNNFSAYIKGEEDFENALKFKWVIKAGTEIYNQNGTTTGTTLETELVSNWSNGTINPEENENGVVETEIEGITYYFKIEDIEKSYAYLDKENKLHVQVKDNVAKDFVYEIGYYTDERVAFKINLTVTGFYTWELAQETLSGATTYRLNSTNGIDTFENGIFKDIKSIRNNRTIDDVVISLKNGEEICYGDITYNDLIQITPGVKSETFSMWYATEIKIAHLKQDVEFVFEVTIKSGENYYTFDFSIIGKASFDETKTRRYVDTTRRYGNVEFSTELSVILNYFTADKFDSENTGMTYKVASNDGNRLDHVIITPTNVATSTIVEKAFTITGIFNNQELLSFEIIYRYTTYPNVKVLANYPSPDGKTVLDREYIATQANEDSLSEAKYISDKIENFFTTKALFGETQRISIEDLTETENLKMSCEISVASIDNAVVYVEDETLEGLVQSKKITNSSDSKLICRYTDFGSIKNIKLNLTFGIINTAQSGSVTFNVSINNVIVTYKVEIVVGDIVKVTTNAPNYIENRELVYAEDLAKYAETTLFAENRILNFTFIPSVTLGTNYYLRFTKDNEVQVIAINATKTNDFINIDLGKSYTGFEYKGTFTNKTSAETNNTANLITDDSIYLSIPKLTSRVVATYHDGTEIALSENVSLQFVDQRNTYVLSYSIDSSYWVAGDRYVRLENDRQDYKIVQIYKDKTQITLSHEFKDYHYDSVYSSISWAESKTNPISSLIIGTPTISAQKETIYSASEFTLKSEDYGKEFGLIVELKLGKEDSAPTISTGAIYNFYLDIEFGVEGNADNPENYTTLDILAGTEQSLLGYFTGFGIKNTRTNKLYSRETLKESGGSISLQIYGFEGTPIVLENNSINNDLTNPLGRTAGEIYKKLVETEIEGIRYYTGLDPKVGASGEVFGDSTQIEVSQGDINKNYITLSGQIENGKTVDYLINAQGSNNDGNHVMMKIIYSVDIGGETITAAHNILFRVVPNSTISFKSRHETSAIYNPSSVEIDNTQSVASNKENPYIINSENSEITFNLWNNNTGEGNNGDQVSTIRAYLYGSTSLNNADRFTYTYTENKPNGYNNWGDLSIIKTDSSCYITVPALALGERNFVVEAENAFGYKLKFYFKVVANENPQIYSVENPIWKEGEKIAVGLRYQTLSATTTSDGYVTYNAFIYKSETDNTGKTKYKNEIILETSDDVTIKKARLVISTPNGTAIREFTNESGLSKISIIGDTQDYEITGSESSTEATHYKFIDTNGDNTQTVKPKINDIIQGGINSGISLEIIPTFVPKDKSGAMGRYSATYNGTALTQTYTPSSGYSYPGNDEAIDVTLSGISAYGFNIENDDSIKISAFDENSIGNYYSRANQIKVKEIEFYYEDELLGTTSITTGNKKLITDNKLAFVDSNRNSELGDVFVNKEKDENGKDTENDAPNFTVPTINGILYGTGTTLSNVRVDITLSDKENECVLSTYVTLQRSADISGLFKDKNKILDAGSPVANDGKTIYNDTLEVVLQPNSSVTFSITDKEAAEGEELTNLITKTNNKPYAITEYVGISASISSLTENLDTTKSVFVNVKESTGIYSFKYNGSRVVNELNIAQYSGITLNIEDVAELNSSNYKTETLYFLVAENGQIYQQVEIFEVYPEFSKATHPTTDTQGNPYFEVADYFKIEKTEDSTKKYYVITRDQWAKEISLSNSISSTNVEALVGEDYHKFVYEINSVEESGSSVGAGSAFIDEFGTITTTEDFDVRTHTITINVYMKVSGQDGNFETNSTKLKLGTFRIYLGKTEPSINVIPAVSEDNDSRVFTINGKSLVVIPNGFRLLITSTYSVTLERGNIISEEIDKLYTVAVGGTLVFENLFNDVENIRNIANKRFRIVKVGDKDIYFDNLDSWQFNTSGEFDVEVVVSGRVEDTITYKKLKFTLFVYDTAVREDQQVDVVKGETTLPIASGETWYELGENNEIKQTDKFESNEIGIFTKTYLVKTEKSSKVLTRTYYVYDGTDSREIAIRPYVDFRLSDLETGAEFYKINKSYNTISKIVYEQFTKNVGESINSNYIVVTRNEDGSISTMKKWTITWNMISANVTEMTDFISSEDDISAKAKDMIAKSLSTTNNSIISDNISLYDIDENGVLTSAVSETAGDKSVVTKTYFAINAKDPANKQFFKFKFTFYVYQANKDIVQQADANIAFSLSELNKTVNESLGTNVTDITYYELSATGVLSRVETISLVENVQKTYYVKVGDNYHLLTFYISIEKNMIYLDFTNGTSTEILDPIAKEILNLSESQTLEYFAFENGKVEKIETLSLQAGEIKNILVKVDKNWRFIQLVSPKDRVTVEKTVTAGTWNLSQFDQDVKNALGLAEDDKNSVLYYAPEIIKDSAGKNLCEFLTLKNSVTVTESCVKFYYINVGNTNYRISVAFNIEQEEAV